MTRAEPLEKLHVTLIGCGKMGSAMLHSWLENNLVRQVDVIDPSPLPDQFAAKNNIFHSPSYDGKHIESDILMLAVKPQILKEAAHDIAQNISNNTAILSIAAGQSLETLETIFGKHTAIIRTMPNTPAAIGKGISISVANKNVQQSQKENVERLLESSGKHSWVTDESLLDAVTALSGSGPAYVFYLIEVMAETGVKLGLDKDLSMMLARQTVIGSAALAESSPFDAAETLRKNVTSPGGTTEAALKHLMDGRFQGLFDEALSAAKARAEELNQ